MDQLTPLERELLRSVSALADGSMQEIDALRASLRDYDRSTTRAIEARLSALERQQETVLSKLADILEGFSERLTAFEGQLKGYESGTQSLNEALGRLRK